MSTIEGQPHQATRVILGAFLRAARLIASHALAAALLSKLLAHPIKIDLACRTGKVRRAASQAECGAGVTLLARWPTLVTNRSP
jgi:hypothetical protein